MKTKLFIVSAMFFCVAVLLGWIFATQGWNVPVRQGGIVLGGTVVALGIAFSIFRTARKIGSR